MNKEDGLITATIYFTSCVFPPLPQPIPLLPPNPLIRGGTCNIAGCVQVSFKNQQIQLAAIYVSI